MERLAHTQRESIVAQGAPDHIDSPGDAAAKPVPMDEEEAETSRDGKCLQYVSSICIGIVLQFGHVTYAPIAATARGLEGKGFRACSGDWGPIFIVRVIGARFMS